MSLPLRSGLLLFCRKRFVAAPPRHLKEENRNATTSFALKAIGDANFPGTFNVFGRHSLAFPERYSVGLSYTDEHGARIALIRCNSAEDCVPRPGDWHHAPHIHRAADNDVSDSNELSGGQITDQYSTYETAMRYLLQHANVESDEIDRYFPSLLWPPPPPTS